MMDMVQKNLKIALFISDKKKKNCFLETLQIVSYNYIGYVRKPLNG